MNLGFARKFGLKLLATLLLFGFLYGTFIYQPSKKATDNEARIRQRQQIVEAIVSESLARASFGDIQVDNSGVFSDLESFNTSYRSSLALIDGAYSSIQQYPQLSSNFDKYRQKVRSTYLSYVSLYQYIDRLFAYSPTDDIDFTGGLSSTELQKRASRSASAIRSLIENHQSYELITAYQDDHSDTVNVSNVGRIKLSSQTLSKLQEAAECFDNLAMNIDSPERQNTLQSCSTTVTDAKISTNSDIKQLLESEATSISQLGDLLQAQISEIKD